MLGWVFGLAGCRMLSLMHLDLACPSQKMKAASYHDRIRARNGALGAYLSLTIVVELKERGGDHKLWQAFLLTVGACLLTFFAYIPCRCSDTLIATVISEKASIVSKKLEAQVKQLPNTTVSREA